MAVRLRDVAELAGVSVKTASNVINDYPHIKPSTRERVEAAIAELRYRPNESARQLKHGRSGFLALAVPQMDAPYFAELASRLSAEAARLGYILLIDTTGADPERRTNSPQRSPLPHHRRTDLLPVGVVSGRDRRSGRRPAHGVAR